MRSGSIPSDFNRMMKPYPLNPHYSNDIMTKKDTQLVTLQPDQYVLNPDGTIIIKLGLLQKLQVNAK